MRSKATWCLGVVLAGLAAAQPAAQGTPTLETVLTRAAEYVVHLEANLSGIVAEENYLQDVNRRTGFLPGVRGPSLLNRTDDEHRELKSDLLLVRPKSADRYIQFRDVFEVNGKPVRDRDDRLASLFLHPSPSAEQQLQDIQEQSARYNIGNVSRDFNVPVIALMFLQENNSWRFKFNVAKTGGPGQPWEIEYHEVEPETLIRTTGLRDLPTHGRFRIDPLTGSVLMSELIAEDTAVHAGVVVTYQMEPTLGFLVPMEMRESLWTRGGSSEIKGRATYSRFRRFQVDVDEAISPPINPTAPAAPATPPAP